MAAGADGAPSQGGEGRGGRRRAIGPYPESLLAVMANIDLGDDLSIPNDELLLLFRKHVNIRGTGRRRHPWG